MATWDEQTGADKITPGRRMPVARQIPQLVAAGLTALVLASGPYWALRSVTMPSSQANTVRTGAVELPPSARSRTVMGQAGTGRLSLPQAGRFVVAFGRFERLEPAQAQARLVRSKGYIAAVIRSGAAYLVVSRPYRSLADAKFWSSIFSNIGLEAKALARPEAATHLPLDLAL